MSYQAGKLKDVKLSADLAAQVLKSCFEYARRWREEDRSSPV